ncbi:hypothetical protein L1987_04322 [Smallanthus sonchifolius]|uniref:Uncharacterized protein n=1 Tax=Smallanthus sonchifolius TaxID=185202 RepID=A0ACB9KD71_9ASTR|nr:hypothetical protein L1987_04322 [Smallanthus sonchifolius]
MSTPIASHAFYLPSIAKCNDEDKQERANMALVFDRYKDRLATLPKEKGWITENVYMYQGFWHQSSRRISVETVMALQDTFKASPADIYLATLPKSGTTWLKALVFALLRDKSRELMTFEEAFELFSKGVMPIGPYWDHVKGTISCGCKEQQSLIQKILQMSFVTKPGLEDDYQGEEANLALIFDRYKDRFTSFPKEKGWMTEDLYKYQGFWHQSKNVVSVETVMATQDTF